MQDAIFVTGGAGFIGSNFIHDWLKTEQAQVINFDKLTYAGNPRNFDSLDPKAPYLFIQGDINDQSLVKGCFEKYRPIAVINFAAETHVDRSIRDPENFIQTNVVGTYTLLQESLEYWKKLHSSKQQQFRFLHISTDEVYGSLSPNEPPFDELSRYAPNSPYAASKAAADHLVRSYYKTYGLPTLTSHSTNNYGPFQFPEKLLPLVILNGLQGKALPIYGNGLNERNWLHVKDHCNALKLIIKQGTVGSVYNVGHDRSISNQDIVLMVCKILDEFNSNSNHIPHADLIEYVDDRPGHDWRYDIDSSKMIKELGWKPKIDLLDGIRDTVQWYIEHPDWLQSVITGEYKSWVQKHY